MRVPSTWLAAAALAVLAAVGCGGSEGYDIAAGPLAGKVGGQSWTVGAGETDPFLSTTQALSVTLLPEGSTACEGGSLDVDSVLIDVPTAAGDYELGLSRTATFYVSATAHNLVATRGRLVVDSVSPMITGGAHIVFNADNEVSGRFSIAICP